MSLTPEALKKLKAQFPDNRICVKLQSLSKDRTRALLVKYLQHTDVADRLDEVDPAWESQIVAEDWKTDNEGRPYCFTHMKLTLLGVSRENSGEGHDSKASASDALKRCAMLFGVGRYLYDEVTVWVPYDDQKDRFREWSVADMKSGAPDRQPRADSDKPPVRPNPTPVVIPGGKTDLPRSKPGLVKEIRRYQDLLELSEPDLQRWARECAGVPADKMDISQLQAFLGQLQIESRKAGFSA